MVRSSDSLESQLLTLPPADRARLAELLLASLDTDLDAVLPLRLKMRGVKRPRVGSRSFERER